MNCVIQFIVLLCVMFSDNQVGDVGAQALGDALKVNAALTTLYLQSMLRV